MSLLTKLTKATTRRKKRVGRGYGSGKGGHTVGRGTKGQLSREGGNVPLWFEGGQLPIIKRMPMLRGKGRFKVVRPTAEITFKDLAQLPTGKKISLETLKLHKIINPRFKKAKVIARGSLEKKVHLVGLLVSAGAKKKIESLGGKIES